MLFLVISLSFTLLRLPIATAQCYGQSTSSLNSDQPCDTGSDPTFCCPASLSCLSIGLCGKSGKQLVMGSCSDPAWSGQCVKYCPDGNGITSCTPESEGNYCCSTGKNKNGQDQCCSNGKTFQLDSVLSASTLPFTKLATSTSKQPSSTAKSTQKVTSSSATAKTTGKSSVGSSSTDSSSTTQTTSAASDLTPSTITSTQTITPTAIAAAPSKGLSTGAKIGVGVGSALGFAFLGFLLFALVFLFRRRRQDKINAIRLSGLRAKAQTSRSFSNNSGSGYIGGGTSETTGLRPEWPSNFPTSPVYSQQYSKPLPHQPREITSIPEQEHLLSPEPSTFDDRNHGGPPIIAPITPPAQRQVYRAYQPPHPPLGQLDTSELGFPEVLHNRTNSGPSFSELVTPTSATAHPPPSRVMTPAEELAAARARSNMTPSTPQNTRRGEALRREDSVVSGLSGRSARDRERDRAELSRGNSVVSGRTEYRHSRQEQ